MLEKVLDNAALRKAAEAIAPGEAIKLAGVWGSSAPLLAAALGRLRNAPVLFITRHLDEADEVADDVEVFTGQAAQLFPAWEVDIGTEHVNDEVAGERLRLCNLLEETGTKPGTDPSHAGKLGCVPSFGLLVAPVMALLQPVPTKEALAAGRLPLEKGKELPPDSLAGWLVDAGFEMVEQVEGQGEFARRGGIVDIFPLGAARAVRVEFFGDQIESIRHFDLDSQRSTEEIAAYAVTGVGKGDRHPSGKSVPFSAALLDYLPADTIVCMLEPAEVWELAEELHRRILDGAASPQVAAGLHGAEEILQAAQRFARVEMHTFAPKDSPSVVALGIRSLERLSINTHEALTELTELSEAAEVWVYCETAAEESRFREVLSLQHAALAGRVRTAVGHVSEGFYWPAQKLVAVGHHEIFHRYAKVRRIRRVRAGRPIESLLDLVEGDYVVHVGHGIAKFEGLRTLQREGRSEEYLRLCFADSAILNVPASNIHLVQKYIGARRTRPTLSKLGGATWARQKAKVSQAVRDFAAELLRIQAMRQGTAGVSYPAETPWQEQFAEEFLYTETEDQVTAIQQIHSDLAVPRPMDRLLCGDVGYGKTELAMRAAFKVVEAGRQVGVLVPTTVLAAQHYRTFQERFADYPFEIEVLSRFRTASEQASILKRLADGQVDVLIGTHRMLSEDVRFADLGLVVIDEEQRFGVEHKERLKGMRATVDMLTMTATPIPRTLHMALLGLRDISNLTTPPLDRRAIHTEVCHVEDKLIRGAILRELNRQGQVFFVHNRVHDIEALAEHVRRLAPEARVEIGHGQMHEHQLERTMLRFVRGEIDVLVCTTIIESGLDIRSANTILIHNADRFGLAELHQLRGRVGRYKHRAFCYLLLPEHRAVSSVAARRLKTIEEFSDLGAGFQIAMRDLEIRGAGNILGREQSGHIVTVGYELYCQLLDHAVKDLRGEAAPLRRDVHVELGIDAYIPRTYVPSDRQRMEIYRRLARCASAAELAQLSADLADAYGPVPDAMQTVLDLSEIRVLAGELGIDSIIRRDPDLVFSVRDFSKARGAFDGAVGTVRLPDDHTAHWRLSEAYRQMPTLVRVLLNRLRQTASPAPASPRRNRKGGMLPKR